MHIKSINNKSSIQQSSIDSFAHIQNLDSEINFRPVHTPWPVMPVSSEANIFDTKDMLSAAPFGLFISVGGDRAFHGLAMATNATHALFMDYDSIIKRFNQINIELLKANTLQEYRFLRWESDALGWQQFIDSSPHTPKLLKQDFTWWVENIRHVSRLGNVRNDLINRYGQDVYFENFSQIYSILKEYSLSNKLAIKEFLYTKDYSFWEKANVRLTKDSWQWWNSYVLNDEHTLGKEWLTDSATIVDLTTVIDLKSDNYLFNETLFERLHQIAVNGHMAVVQFDVRETLHLNKLVEAIKKSKLAISAIDLNNIWMSGYTQDGDSYQNMVKSLATLGEQGSVLLTMAYACGTHIYTGFTFKNIMNWPENFSVRELLDRKNDSLGLLHKKLFHDHLPKLTHVGSEQILKN